MDHKELGRYSESVFQKISRYFSQVCEIIMGLFQGCLILLIGVSLLLMNTIGQPIGWSNAVGRYIYIYIVLIGSAMAYIKGEHPTINLFYDRCGRKTRLIIDLTNYLVVMSFSILMILFGLNHSIKMWPIMSPVLPFFSMGILYLSVPLSFTIVFIYTVKATMKLISEGKIRKSNYQ